MNRVATIAALLLLFAPGPARAAVAELPLPWIGESIVADPEWQKRFLGSYGFLSGAEPKVAQAEIETLREVIELMRVNPEAAAKILTAKVGPDSSAALDFILANLNFQNGQHDLALAQYQSALAKFPDFRRAHKNLGLLLVQKGRYTEARGHLSKAVELGDRDGRNYGLLGYCYVNEENHLAAEEAYRNAILQEPETRDWKLGLARSLLAMEKHKEAVALFASLIDANPDDTSAWMLQANAYLGLDRPLDAAVNLEAVRMMGKGQTRSLVLLGDIYMNQGMTEMAKSAYLEVIQTDGDGTRFETAYRAADLLVRTRAWKDAQEVLDGITARYRELPTEDELRVLTLEAKVARATGREKEAAKLLESIVERDGTRGEALLELATYYRDQGDREHALLLIERAERLEDFEYRALLEHAQFMVGEKDYVRAAELLRQALLIKSEPRVQTFLARVEQAIRP